MANDHRARAEALRSRAGGTTGETERALRRNKAADMLLKRGYRS